MYKTNDLKSFDGHVHSYFSFDVKERPESSPVNLFLAGLKRGMHFVTLTDHDEYRQNEFVFEKLAGSPLLTQYVPGTEFTIRDKQTIKHTIHVNVYMHTRQDFENLLKLRTDLIAFVKYCTQKNLPFQYNHPVWFDQGEDNNISEENLKLILKYAKLFPVIETSNSNRPIEENKAAEFIARVLYKGCTSNSDSHFGNVGLRGYTQARGKTFLEFWENVKKRETILINDNMTGDILKRKVLLALDHLAFPTKIKPVNESYGCDTGNRTVNAFLRLGNRAPLLVRVLRPYLRRKVRRTKLIDGYIQRQNSVGKRAYEFFEKMVEEKMLQDSIKSYL